MNSIDYRWSTKSPACSFRKVSDFDTVVSENEHLQQMRDEG